MRRVLKASSMTGGASAFNLLVSAARIKFVALLVSTAGMGVIAYLVNYVQLAVSVTTLGIGSGIVKLTSEYSSARKEDEVERLKITSVSMTFWFSVVVSMALLLFAREVSVLLIGNENYTLYIRLVSLSIPFLTLTQCLTSILNGHKAIREIALVMVCSAVISLAIVVPLVWKYRITGVVLHFLFSAVAGLIVVAAFYRWRIHGPNLFRLLSFRGFDRNLLRLLAAFGAATLVMGVCQQSSFLLVRKLIDSRFGEHGNGLYQVPYGLTLQYLNIVLTALLTYSLPTMSAIPDRDSLQEEMNKTMRASLLVIVPVISSLLVLKKFLVLLLFSKEFLPSVKLLEVQLLGDFFKVMAFVFGVAVLARARLRAWLLLDIFWDVLFVSLSLFLLPRMGLLAVAVAFFASYLAMSIAYGLFVRRAMNLSLTMDNLKLVALSIAALAGVAVASDVFFPVAAAATVGILALWMLLCFKKAEFVKGWAIFRHLSWGEDDPLRLP